MLKKRLTKNSIPWSYDYICIVINKSLICISWNHLSKVSSWLCVQVYSRTEKEAPLKPRYMFDISNKIVCATIHLYPDVDNASNFDTIAMR